MKSRPADHTAEERERGAPWFRVLKVAHDPKDPPEATLVLAAAAAANGLRCDGQPMEGAVGARGPSLQWISRQLCLPISAVRRGLEHLVEIGAARVDGGVLVEPQALASRWANHRQRLCLTTEARQVGLRARPLLLTALVAGQVNQQGQLRLGLGFLEERTGIPRRSLERTLAAARKAGAVHTWLNPNGWQLHLALGPSRSGARRASRTGARREAPSAAESKNDDSPPADHREAAEAPVTKWRTPHHETAEAPSRNGVRPPDVHPDVHPDSPPERTPAPPAGETKAGPRQPEGAPPATPGIDAAEARRRVEAWTTAFIAKGVERLEPKHAAEVAGLFDQLGPAPALIHDRRAFGAERRALALRVIRWEPNVERLGRWLVRVTRRFGVSKLAGYLRRACEKGDPGSVLESDTKNRFGRAAENWRDFSTKTERDLEGAHLAGVQDLIAGFGRVLGCDDSAERSQLREEFRRYMQQGRRAAARTVLLQIVGDDRSDVAIARAVGDACSLAIAKELLAA